MYKEPTEFRVTTILDLLPSTEVEVKGKRYRAYLEEKVVGSDRCLGFTNEEMPTKPFLFQVTQDTGDKNRSEVNLKELDIKNEEHM